MAGGAAAPADGFGPAAFAAATLPSSSGRGARLSGEVPIGFAPAAAADRNSGGEPTGLEPRSETPRKTVPLSEEEGGPLMPGPAGTPGGEDAAAGEAGGGEAAVGATGGAELDDGENAAAAPRESVGLDVTPGEEMGCPGGVAVVPAAGAAVPVGCHPDGDGGDSG